MTETTLGAGDPILELAFVLGVQEETATVLWRDKPTLVPFAAPFPRPRLDRVLPGHLVAIVVLPGGRGVVIWRWFDAVVLESANDQARLWEPLHGEVVARLRDGAALLLPGTRAYLSSGLPGADWWLAGPTAGSPQAAEVEIAEVTAFFTDHDLWDRL